MAIDFITALGRLLRDGNVRDLFATNPRAAADQVQLRESDVPAWLQLAPADVEAQAAVLLRKRLDLVKYFAPETCRRSGENLWGLFQKYARMHWPTAGCARISDAHQFCRELMTQSPQNVCRSEWYRMEFAHSTLRFALHWTTLRNAKGKDRAGLQIFVRGREKNWREFFIYIGW